MARTGESIELIVAEGLWASSIPETRPIPDGVIDILCLVDLGARGSELMQMFVTGLIEAVGGKHAYNLSTKRIATIAT